LFFLAKLLAPFIFSWRKKEELCKKFNWKNRPIYCRRITL